MTEKFVAVQHNSDGRPCGWGRAPTVEQAKEEAERQYNSHGFEECGFCYPGEEKGKLTLYRDNGSELIEIH